MIRHYFQKGKRPPVERLIECASPRNGVPSGSLGDLLVGLRILPGARLVEQMKAAGPFIWDLSWMELEFAADWPSTIAITGLPRKRTLVMRLIGGQESDNIVPAALCNPNPVFGQLSNSARSFSPRAFRIFYDSSHTGPKGLLSHIKTHSDGLAKNPADPAGRALKDYIRSSPSNTFENYGEPGADVLCRTFAIVRVSPSAFPSGVKALNMVVQTSANPEARVTLTPLSRNDEAGFALFEVISPSSQRETVRFTLKRGNKEWPDEAFGLQGGLAPGQIAYIDLR